LVFVSFNIDLCNGRGYTVSTDLNSEKGYRHYSIGKHSLENGTGVRGGEQGKKKFRRKDSM